MKFKKIEKEFMRALVKYNDSVNSIAEVLNESKFLEKRGVAIIPRSGINVICLKKNKYNYDSKEAYGYITELISLIDLLVKDRYIVIVPMNMRKTPIIGRNNAIELNNSEITFKDCNEIIHLNGSKSTWRVGEEKDAYWFKECGEGALPISRNMYYSYTVSQELRSLVDNDFKTEEEIRFRKQQNATWVSIGLAFIIGLVSIIISICK